MPTTQAPITSTTDAPRPSTSQLEEWVQRIIPPTSHRHSPPLTQVEASTGAPSPHNIQHLAHILIQVDSPGGASSFSPYRYLLRVVETDKLYDNAIHFSIESVMSIYLTNKRDKALRRNFGLLERRRASYRKRVRC